MPTRDPFLQWHSPCAHSKMRSVVSVLWDLYVILPRCICIIRDCTIVPWTWSPVNTTSICSIPFGVIGSSCPQAFSFHYAAAATYSGAFTLGTSIFFIHRRHSAKLTNSLGRSLPRDRVNGRMLLRAACCMPHWNHQEVVPPIVQHRALLAFLFPY